MVENLDSDITEGLKVSSGVDFEEKDIVAVVRQHISSPEGYASTEVLALLLLPNGVALLSAGCDTTGWDCQAGGSVKKYATIDEAVADMDQETKERLGFGKPLQAYEPVLYLGNVDIKLSKRSDGGYSFALDDENSLASVSFSPGDLALFKSWVAQLPEE